MKRNVKNNLMLILTLSLTGVAALVLLALIAIEHRRFSGTHASLMELTKNINELNGQEPAPMEENKLPMQQDLVFYQGLQKELSYKFGTPLQPAKGKFLSTLLTVDGKNLTEEEFRNKFRKGWNEDGHGWDEVVGNEAKRNFYITQFKKNFQNWSAAVEAFKKEAMTRTTEPMTRLDSIILRLFGVSLPMDAAQIDEFSGLSAETIRLDVNGKLKISENALGFGFPAGSSINVDESPLVPFHWDVIGDLVKRMAAAPVIELNSFSIRKLAGEKSGVFRRYHYSFRILGTMKMIRALCLKLDQAYADNRFYLVQSVFLFAHSDEANELINPAQGKDAGGDSPMVVRRSFNGKKEAEENDAAEKAKEDAPKTLVEGSVIIGADDCVYAVFDVEYIVWAE